MNITTNKYDAYLDVIKHFGGIVNLAKALKITPHAIYQWKKIPLARAFQIELLTNGKFKAKKLLKVRSIIPNNS
jgi:transcriptional repressor of cell division inhibition gene dicB